MKKYRIKTTQTGEYVEYAFIEADVDGIFAGEEIDTGVLIRSDGVKTYIFARAIPLPVEAKDVAHAMAFVKSMLRITYLDVTGVGGEFALDDNDT